jgi:PAS domain S-box-containing protein
MNLDGRWWLRYGLAGAVTLAAVVLRLALTPFIGPGPLYITAYPAMMIVTIALGLGPGLFGTAISILLIEAAMVGSVDLMTQPGSFVLRAALLLITTFYVGRVGDRLRVARSRADAAALAARTALDRYLSFMQVTGQVGWTTNAAGEVVEDMPAWREFTGQTVAEVRGWGWSDAVHPDDLDKTSRVWREAVESKTTYEIEYRVRRHDGEYRTILARGVPALNEDGSVREWVGACIDITERKRAEEALLASEHRLNRAQEVSHLGSWELDLRTNELTWSDEVYRIFGLEPQEFGATYEAFLEHVHPDDRAAVNDAYTGSLRDSRDHYEIEHRVVRKSTGEIRYVHEKCEHIRDNQGVIILSVGMVHDITERKRAEIALRESEQRVRRKLESVLSPEGDLSLLELGDLIDAGAVQKLMDDFYAVAHIPMSIIDVKDRVLVGVGWQDICTRFHRVHPEAARHCLESDTELSAGLAQGDCRLYKCKNNLWDMATPILVAGQHVGDVFTGQFFFEDETIDRERFRAQARAYGFDEAEYLAALDRVPRLSRETVDRGMAFFVKLADTLSQIGFSNVKLARSVAERDRLTDSLLTSREWLRVTLTSIGDAVIASDTEARITFLNPVAIALTGWSAEEALGQPISSVFKVINELTREPIEGPCLRVLKEKRAVALANHSALITKDGREIPVEDSAAPILDADGNVRGVVLVFHDVTERRHAENALRKSYQELEIRVHERTAELRQSMDLVQAERKRFRDVFDQLPAYLVLITRDHYVPLANRFFEERFGKSNGLRCYEYLFGRTEPCENCETFKVFETNAPHRWEWTGPDGHNYDIYDFPFTDVDGSNLVMEVGLDITERKKAEAELEEYRAHLEDLVRERTAQFEAANQQLQAEIIEHRQAEDALRFSRAAAINLMEDAVEARRQTEQTDAALRESQADLNRAQMVGSIGSWRLDVRRNELLWSDENHRIFGIPKGTPLSYESFLGVIHPDDRAYVDEKWAAGLRGELYDIEHRLVVDGAVKWVREKAELEFDEYGELRGGFGTTQDITQLKRTEEALRRAHDELERRVEERTAELRRVSLYARSLIEASLDPMVTINPRGQITDVNQAAELATGVSSLDLIESDFADYFTEPEKAREVYRQVLAEGQVIDLPLTIRHASGSLMDVLYNASVYRNDAGEVQGVFAAARDITQRKRIEEALRDSERLLVAAQRIAHLGGWDWRVAENHLIWSDETYRIFGLEPQSVDVNAARYVEMVHPEDRTMVLDRVKRALEGVEPFDVTCRIVLPDSTERVLRAQSEVMRDESGAPVRMFGTVLDITDRIRAEEEARIRQQQLVQADKMVSLGILVSGVAHEINNPNHSIMSNVSSLADVWTSVQPILDGFYKDFGDFVLGGFEYSECRDKLPEMFARALASSERIRVIVDELRDFARYSPQEQMTTVDVNAVVESASILMSNMIRKSTDHFEVSRAGHLPPIRGNFQRLEQVVINLIQNACRSLADRDKSIQVITGYDANSRQIRIEVIDEGAGISEENLKHLGDPFFTTKRSAGGMGLGLWVSFNIVHEHGGTLTYSSKPGEGTRAVLALPMSQNNDSPESSEQNATDQA